MANEGDHNIRGVTDTVEGWAAQGAKFSESEIEQLSEAVTKLRHNNVIGTSGSSSEDPVVEEATPNRSG